MIVLNSRINKTSSKTTCPIKQPWSNVTAKTDHKCIGKTLAMLKIVSKVLKMCLDLELSYRILKISQTTRFSSACWPARLPAVTPSSTSAGAPDFSDHHCKITNLLFQRRFLYCILLPPLILQSIPFLFLSHDKPLVPVNMCKLNLYVILHRDFFKLCFHVSEQIHSYVTL